MAPQTPDITTFQKNGGPDTRSVMYTEFLNIKYDPHSSPNLPHRWFWQLIHPAQQDQVLQSGH